jgi:hypothetical protein
MMYPFTRELYLPSYEAIIFREGRTSIYSISRCMYIALYPCGPLRNPFAAFCRKKNKIIPKLTLAEMGEMAPLTTNEEKLEMTCE